MTMAFCKKRMNILKALFGGRGKTYHHIISLGYNCEFAFQFHHFYAFVESGLFTWAYVKSEDGLVEYLDNLAGLFSEGILEPNPLYECKKYEIRFHGKAEVNEKNELTPEEWEHDKQELIERVHHLQEKFIMTLRDNKKKLFVLKISPRNGKVVEFVSKIKSALRKKTHNYDILLIFQIKDYMQEYDVLKDSDTFIRFVNHYPPEDKLTSVELADMAGWENIMKEFVPKARLKKEKIFKFERKHKEGV